MKTLFYQSFFRTTGLAAALLFLLCAGTACDKEVRPFTGAYSCKTSGSLILEKMIPAALDTLHLPDTLTVVLTPESGQMRIAAIKDDPDDYNLMISINLLAGDAMSFRAKTDDKRLTLETATHERYIQANVSANAKMTIGIITSGGGQLYDDVIVFDLHYAGMGLYNGVPYRIIESHIDCIATAND